MKKSISKNALNAGCILCKKIIGVFDEKHIANIKDLTSYLAYTVYVFITLYKSTNVEMYIVNTILSNIITLEEGKIIALTYLLITIFVFNLAVLWLWTWLRKKFNDHRAISLKASVGIGDKQLDIDYNNTPQTQDNLNN